MYVAEQITQEVASVQSAIALARASIWRVVGDDGDDDDDDIEITDSPIQTQYFAISEWLGASIDGHSLYSDEAIFDMLVRQWHRERGATSSITEMAMCPAYQRIIAMGPPKAVPLILRQMAREGNAPDMWFWALRVLTDADPISDEDRGDTVRMAQAWLSWARYRYAW
jgi:hypothetical protein